MNVWHYAPWSTLRKIINSGELIPSNAGAAGESPVLWFSANQKWEQTATKMINSAQGPRRLTFAEQVQGFGCIRFGLPAADPRLLPWAAACRSAGTPREVRRRMEVVGRKQGAQPEDWHGCMSAIPLSQLAFEVWIGAWHPADPAEMAQVWEDRNRPNG